MKAVASELIFVGLGLLHSVNCLQYAPQREFQLSNELVYSPQMLAFYKKKKNTEVFHFSNFSQETGDYDNENSLKYVEVDDGYNNKSVLESKVPVESSDNELSETSEGEDDKEEEKEEEEEEKEEGDDEEVEESKEVDKANDEDEEEDEKDEKDEDEAEEDGDGDDDDNNNEEESGDLDKNKKDSDNTADDNDENNRIEVGKSKSFNYKTQKVNGVNLGGWLVTEPFISPSLYEQASSDGTEAKTPVDEYTFCQQLGPRVARERLKKHWDTWITEADIVKIKSYGFNAVRLPIGYWAFARLPDDPYVFGQEFYLDKTIQWCRTHGLKLWIDLHGIPGSQNGFDNSGRRDVYMWANPQNYNLGIQVLQYIYDKYGGEKYADVVIGYQNLNEPLHTRYEVPMIVEFDRTTYNMFREKSDNYFVFHDAFLPPEFWHRQIDEPQFKDTVLDHHRYEVFHTTQLKETVDGHITSIRLITEKFLNVPRVQVVGEWSAAMTDCAKWLNGVGRGARLDNTFEGNGVIGQCRFSNDYSKMTEQDKIDTRRIVEAQLDIFNQTNGFFFWTWKTENAIEWSMSSLAEHGLFPVPLTDRKYPRVV